MKTRKERKPKPTKFAIWWKWPLIVLALSFVLSLAFGIVSEVALSEAGLAVSIVVILIFILIAIIADMVGVAATAANFEPFRAMAARKVRGAKESIKLINHKEVVASVAADVIGDICGILAGAAGATITIVLIKNYAGSFLEVLIASLVSAVIAALTIFGKAYCKKYAMLHSEKIVLILGKFISLFCIHKKDTTDKKANKKDKNKKKDNVNNKEKKGGEVLTLTKPDFNKNILNVSASLAQFLGCPNNKPTLEVLNEELKKGYKNIVFIIFDGLGMNPISINLDENDFLRAKVKEVLTTVFPATTTNATTTLHTNMYPMEHGRFGWSIYFEEIGRNVDIYVGQDSKTKEKVSFDFIEEKVPLKAYYLDANTDYAINRVAPSYWTDNTKENHHICEKVDEFFEEIQKICQTEGKQFIYSYCPEPDATMHDNGVTSKEAKTLITHISQKMEELCKTCGDTLFIVTADHGQVDVEGYVELYKNDKLLSMLETPPYLEPRATAFKVKEGLKEDFVKLFNDCYGNDFELHSSKELVDAGYFGGKYEDKFASLLGDYIAICKTHKQFVIYEKSPRFKGHHCSLTEEVFVPLIVISSPKK